jgi:uncharacterized protein (DUF1330 family)
LKGYLILDFTIVNLPEFMEYVEKIPAYLKRHKGKYLVEGVTPEVIEGDWFPNTIVVLEFNSTENAKQFISDPEVKELFKIRHHTTNSNLILVNGGSWRDEVNRNT